MDDLRPNESAVAHVRALMPDAQEARVRARVAQMGLTAEKMNTAGQGSFGRREGAAADGPGHI
jgi:ATP-binding cassette subfamily F protein 3